MAEYFSTRISGCGSSTAKNNTAFACGVKTYSKSVTKKKHTRSSQEWYSRTHIPMTIFVGFSPGETDKKGGGLGG